MDIDPFQIADAFADLNASWQKDQDLLIQYCRTFHESMQATHQRVLDRFQAEQPVESAENPAQFLMHWVDNLAWSSRQYHHVLCKSLAHYVDQAPDLNQEARQKTRFWVGQIQNMSEPANFFWTNTKAVQRMVNSKGQSVTQGLRNWSADMRQNNGLVSLAEKDSFIVGENLAATEGSVIFRNELMEVIQYAPQTEKVHRVPIVMIQPWINKYYIFDLSARNSFVNYLIQQGFTVFITSWKNPGSQMRHVTYDDYMLRGAMQAVHIACAVCDITKVHLTGYCIGGTLVTTLMGWLAHDEKRSPVADVTLFSTLVDFSNPGDLGSLLHDNAIDAIEEMLAEKGILEDHRIAAAFRMLNPRDLIWRYVANNYFCGDLPPKSDMLYWNSDSTNLTQAMCSFFLKSFYLKNRITMPGALRVAGRSIDLRKVCAPFYIVGAEKDHICPWKSTFQTSRLIGGKVRYVLADEGHITGIVNPPSPWSKKKYWAASATRLRNAEKWLAKQEPRKGSWWPDWVQWLKPRSAGLTSPPSTGSDAYPTLCPAPGTYVMEGGG